VKSTKPQTYESKKERKQTHQRLFTQFGPTMTYSGGEIDLSNPLSNSSYKKIQMGYKKLAQELTKNKT